jgi:small subunit ribosomal protein S17
MATEKSGKKTAPAKKATTPAPTPAPASVAQQQPKPHRRQRKQGRVTSDKMQKTIVVAVEELKRHRVYKRTYRYTTKFKAHDEFEEARIGDMVVIEETRPLSKEKRWKLVKIMNRAVQTMPVEEVVAQLAPEIESETTETAETEGEEE